MCLISSKTNRIFSDGLASCFHSYISHDDNHFEDLLNVFKRLNQGGKSRHTCMVMHKKTGTSRIFFNDLYRSQLSE